MEPTIIVETAAGHINGVSINGIYVRNLIVIDYDEIADSPSTHLEADRQIALDLPEGAPARNTILDTIASIESDD